MNQYQKDNPEFVAEVFRIVRNFQHHPKKEILTKLKKRFPVTKDENIAKALESLMETA